MHFCTLYIWYDELYSHWRVDRICTYLVWPCQRKGSAWRSGKSWISETINGFDIIIHMFSTNNMIEEAWQVMSSAASDDVSDCLLISLNHGEREGILYKILSQGEFLVSVDRSWLPLSGNMLVSIPSKFNGRFRRSLWSYSLSVCNKF